MVSDDEIEKEIVTKGLTAPRITLEHIEQTIIGEEYKVFEHTNLTVCMLVLRNGFTVSGESACASPENFDAELGKKISRQKAKDKIWMLEGYLLKQTLFEQSK